MRTMTLRRKRRWIAVAFAAMLVAAPAAQARIDEGGAGVAGETPIRIVQPDGFSWADAGIGAGAAFGTVLVLGGAGRAVRNHLVPARP